MAPGVAATHSHWSWRSGSPAQVETGHKGPGALGPPTVSGVDGAGRAA